MLRLFKQVVSDAAGEKTSEAYHSHPPNPKLSEQLIPQVGYDEDFRDENEFGCFSEIPTAAQVFFQQGRRERDD